MSQASRKWLDSEDQHVNSSLNQWLQQGEELYSTALNEYREIEAQLDELEAKLAAKQSEVNQIASVIGKPPVEGNRRLSAELVGGQMSQAATAASRKAPTPPSPARSPASSGDKLGSSLSASLAV
jgi:cell division septum initiation protein DivIVA